MSDTVFRRSHHINVPYPDAHVETEAPFTRPNIDPTVWIAQTAFVNGRVTLKAHSSVWYGCVLRGDTGEIAVGEESNIQDLSVLHTDSGWPCLIGKRVTVGHNAVVHGSVVKDGALIGISATILSRCVIGEGALIAGGALVLEGTQVPPHTLWAGVPAKQVKVLSAEQRARLAETWQHYVNNSKAY